MSARSDNAIRQEKKTTAAIFFMSFIVYYRWIFGSVFDFRECSLPAKQDDILRPLKNMVLSI